MSRLWRSTARTSWGLLEVQLRVRWRFNGVLRALGIAASGTGVNPCGCPTDKFPRKLLAKVLDYQECDDIEWSWKQTFRLVFTLRDLFQTFCSARFRMRTLLTAFVSAHRLDFDSLAKKRRRIMLHTNLEQFDEQPFFSRR